MASFPLAATTLRARGGVSVSGAAALRGKAVLLLFSSVWCPDCKPFCGKLKRFLAQVRSAASASGQQGGSVEVVWVSSDRSAAAAEAYFEAEHEWLMVPFDDPLRNELKRKYGFCAGAEKDAVGVEVRNGGIPTLALVADNGDLIATLRSSKAFAMQTLTRMAEAAATATDDAAAPPAATVAAGGGGDAAETDAGEKKKQDNPHVEPASMPVYQLECQTAFAGLTPKERLYAYHVGRASWEGAKICLFQTSPESPFIFELLQRVFAGSDAEPPAPGAPGAAATPSAVLRRLQDKAAAAGVTPDAFKAFLTYAAAFYGNVGNYRSFGDTKIVPGCSEDDFVAVVRASEAHAADPAGVDALYAATQGRVFSLTPHEAQLGMAPGGVSTYYSSDVTEDEARAVQEFMDEKGISAYNTRLFKGADGAFELRTAAAVATSAAEPVTFKGMSIKVTTGDHAALMARVVDHLTKAQAYAANDAQRAMLAEYVKCFGQGDMQAHVEGSRHWIKDKGPAVESYIGFIESYQDPFGVRGAWEGFCAVVNRDVSAKFQVLVDAATRLLPLLPWPREFEKDVFLRPDFTSLDVLEFGTSGVPAGINIPNYDVVRQRDGFKNVSLGNVLAGRMKPAEGKMTSFIRTKAQAAFKRLVGPAFEVQVGLHELLGHGSGKMFLSEDQCAGVTNPLTGAPVTSWYGPGETWDSKFPGFGSSYEECRAECVGIFLCVNPDVQDIFGHGPGNAEQPGADVAYVNWLSMARAGVLALQYYSPEAQKWGQAHMQARFCILRVLLEAGEGFVQIVPSNPDRAGASGDGPEPAAHPAGDTCVLLDRAKIESVGVKAIGAFLQRIQVYKATADNVAAKEMYDKYSTVDERFLALREEVVGRREPRNVWVQGNFEPTADGSDVGLTLFEPSVEGVIRSFSRRFPARDDALVALATAEAAYHRR